MSRVSLMVLLISFNSIFSQDRPTHSYINANTAQLYSINESSGKLGISIPLLTLESKGMSLPLTLDYSYDGYKKTDIAPWVGKGWNIGGLGSISRNINGYPDDKSINLPLSGAAPGGGFLRHNYSLSSPWPSNLEGFVSDTRIDITPDIYNYSANGISGTFTVKRSSESNKWADVVQLPFTSNKILSVESSIDNRFTGFNILDPFGIKYEFHITEGSSVRGGSTPCYPDNIHGVPILVTLVDLYPTGCSTLLPTLMVMDSTALNIIRLKKSSIPCQ